MPCLNRKFKLILFVLIFAGSTAAYSETHLVTVGDFFFSPQNLTINEGDLVRWVWETGGHDVAEGELNTQDSERAFLSGDSTSEAGATYEVRFDRTLINSYPRTNNRYDYVCRPHAGFMFGSITVTRQPKSLRADLNSWQVVPDSGSAATGTLDLTLSASETSLAVTGSHSVSSATSIILRVGAVGASSGTPFCTLSGASPVNGTCTGLSQAIADSIYSGDAFIEVKSPSFSNGEIRGQIYRVSSDTQSVSGRVRDDSENPISGATVTDGARNATSGITGSFTLSNVPNGVYRISGSSGSSSLVPNDGVNPYLVNNLDVTGRNLTLFVLTTPTPTATPTSIPKECDDVGGVGVEIVSPKENEVLKSFSAKLTANILISSASKIEFSVNGNQSTIIEDETENFIGRQGLNSISAFAVDGSSNRVCSGVERLFSISSPLTEENFEIAKKYCERANRAKATSKKLLLLKRAKRKLS